ncbi:MAG: hypothetical protein KatS3mg011_0587 [Acidimicrobiia bacterium]|nr:MAG: hypothetical protein KatS3mg011_0587 [Acidimicrobiia bacterium]
MVVAEPTPAAAWTGALEAIAVRGPLLVADDPDLVAAELERLRPARVVVVGSPPRDVRFESELVVVPPRAVEPPRAVLGSAGEPLWMVAADPDPQHAAAWAVTWTGHSYVEVEDPGRIPGQWLRLLQAAEPVVPLGFDATDLWWLEAIRAGNQLPGGGVWLFPGRRLVAFYGSPDTPSLGVLGEQGPAETLRRMQPLLEAYTADGSQVLPTFEIIATVASARPTADGDYSAEVDLDTLRPWVDEAARVGAYVVLDLQPGRAPFLEQARRYEELLSMPHVGLALDPEWRLGPGEVHLRRVGSVDAEEVNGVAEWLAGLVRAHRLPQKLLVVHQFKESMIRDRDRLEIPPELALVIQMDGQGPLGSKYATWRNITGGRDPSWWWGWKNFLDEDRPVASPDQVMELDPTPVFVSYQ